MESEVIFMGRRSAVRTPASKRLYTSTSGVHPKNLSARPMRGGIRL